MKRKRIIMLVGCTAAALAVSAYTFYLTTRSQWWGMDGEARIEVDGRQVDGRVYSSGHDQVYVETSAHGRFIVWPRRGKLFQNGTPFLHFPGVVYARNIPPEGVLVSADEVKTEWDPKISIKDGACEFSADNHSRMRVYSSYFR